MPQRRRGLGDDPNADLLGPAAASVPVAATARTETAEVPARPSRATARPTPAPAAPPTTVRAAGAGRPRMRVMVYLEESDGRWLNETVGRARAEGFTQRELGENAIIRAGLALLQDLSWSELLATVQRQQAGRS
jgi:hypothetical protein